MTDTYVLGDWGTTRLRLFRMADGVVVDRADGPGIGMLDTPPAQVLMQLLEGWRAETPLADVTLCGMAGARGGLVEAAYVPCPAGIDAWRAGQTRMLIDGLRISVVPGIRCRSIAGVPDVMRGEETQIFGAMAVDPALAKGERVFLLPGTHSKWAHVVDGALESFVTCPTGELHELLSQRSTLTGPAQRGGKGDFQEGFAHGLGRASEALMTALFEARAARMLDDRSRDWATGYLSGLLIGSEVAAQASVTGEVIVVGAPALCGLYAQALQAASMTSRLMAGEATALAGLNIARSGIA